MRRRRDARLCVLMRVLYQSETTNCLGLAARPHVGLEKVTTGGWAAHVYSTYDKRLHFPHRACFSIRRWVNGSLVTVSGLKRCSGTWLKCSQTITHVPTLGWKIQTHILLKVPSSIGHSQAVWPEYLALHKRDSKDEHPRVLLLTVEPSCFYMSVLVLTSDRHSWQMLVPRKFLCRH